MSAYEEAQITCKKELKFPSGTTAFKKDHVYNVRIFVKSATVKDEEGCLRPLYDEKNDKFYKEYFKPIVKE